VTRWILDQHAMEQMCALARDDDPLHLFSQSPDDCERLVSDALSGVHRHAREAFAQRLGTRRTPFDRLSAELLAHEGIDPLCLCVLSGKIETTGVMRPDQYETDEYTAFVERQGRSFSGFVMLAKGTTWRFNEGPTFEGMPDTVVTAMTGRTLDGIMSHPVVDAATKRVTGVRQERFGDTVYTHVETAPSCVTLTPQELLAIDVRQGEAS
jgi:hypothetical protein